MHISLVCRAAHHRQEVSVLGPWMQRTCQLCATLDKVLDLPDSISLSSGYNNACIIFGVSRRISSNVSEVPGHSMAYGGHSMVAFLGTQEYVYFSSLVS